MKPNLQATENPNSPPSRRQPKKQHSYPIGEFKIMPVRESVIESQLVDTPERAAAYWRANIPNAPWFDPAKEAFIILILNVRRRIMGHNLVTLGLLDTCYFHPREIFRPAIIAGASAIILMHNHPSGDRTPSEADIKVTREAIKAGAILRIDVLDHVIMGREHLSLRELGYFSA